jgi:hypothetical protein
MCEVGSKTPQNKKQPAKAAMSISLIKNTDPKQNLNIYV